MGIKKEKEEMKMTNSKSTKKALFSSLLAMLVCVTMLIGTTFAWFTDTSSTNVNKIQSGTLDVELQMFSDGQWVSAEGKTLDFAKAEEGAGQEILWEPGCTYELPQLRVTNKGNLALKYKIVVTGTSGDAKLLDVIDFSVDGVSLDEEFHLSEAQSSDAFTIKGHMKEETGNEYQGLTLEGISITIYATQYTEEYDSYDNQYDKEAAYSANTATELVGLLTNAKDGDTIVLTDSIEISADDYNVNKRLYVKANNVTIDLNGKELTVPNHTFTLSGENITLKNGYMIATTTSSTQTIGSYAVAANGKNVTIESVTMVGGISVTGYNQEDDALINPNVSALITDCKIEATNYYTVCAQGQATAVVKNSTLVAENGVAFFWIEKGFTDAAGTVGDSSLSYQASTVILSGSKPLYNAGGLEPIVLE